MTTAAPPPRSAPRLDLRFERYRNTKHFRGLDGLRCVSILAVIWHHVGAAEHGSLLGALGRNGVHLFFAISGFLITTLLLRERDRAGQISLRKFYIRRSLRIFPLYYVAVGLYLMLVLAMEAHSEAGRAFLHNIRYFLTYTSNWFVDIAPQKRVIFYFAWSLATEEQFYLLWPSVVHFTRGWRLPVAIMLLATGAAILESRLFAIHAPGKPLVWRIISSIQPAICLGAVMAFVLHSPIGFRRASFLLGRRPSVVASVAVLAACFVIWGASAQTSTAMVLLIASIMLRPDNVLSPFLDNPLIRYLGTISYGMYMLHMLGLQVARKASGAVGAPAFVTFLLAVAIAACLASISYWCFEVRFLRLKERYGNAVPDPKTQHGVHTHPISAANSAAVASRRDPELVR